YGRTLLQFAAGLLVGARTNDPTGVQLHLCGDLQARWAGSQGASAHAQAQLRLRPRKQRARYAADSGLFGTSQYYTHPTLYPNRCGSFRGIVGPSSNGGFLIRTGPLGTIHSTIWPKSNKAVSGSEWPTVVQRLAHKPINAGPSPFSEIIQRGFCLL